MVRFVTLLACMVFLPLPDQARLKAAETLVCGADVSAVPVFEAHGARYRDGEKGADAIAVLRKAGIDCFRLRLFVAPDGRGVVTNDQAYTLALAKRVKASGARFMLDLHFSDTWADPAKQFKPAAWANLSMDELVATIRDYTRKTLEAFFAADVAPDFLQVGNEITNGLLWPDGRVEFQEAGDVAAWTRLSRLLRASLEGVDAAVASAKTVRPKIVFHIESTGDVARSTWWLRNATEAGLSFDIVGLSYYPEWHGGIASLSETLAAVATTFGKPVMVVETAYPWKDDGHWSGKKNLDWPLTPAGQRQFLEAVMQAVKATPGNRGTGVFWWHPESVPTDGLNAWVGGSCALFDERGALLPAAAVFRADSAR